MTIGDILLKNGVIVTSIEDFCEEVGDQYRIAEDKKAFLRK